MLGSVMRIIGIIHQHQTIDIIRCLPDAVGCCVWLRYPCGQWVAAISQRRLFEDRRGQREPSTTAAHAAATSNEGEAETNRRLQTGESCATNFGRESSDRSLGTVCRPVKISGLQALQSGLNLDMYDNDPFEIDAVRAYDVDEPDKAAMLEYLDNEGPEPPRYARAWVYHGAGDDDFMMEYRVGPIDAAAGTVGGIEPLTVPGNIPARTMMMDYKQRRMIRNVVNGFVYHPTMQQFLIDAFGSTNTIEWSMHENELQADTIRYANIAYRRKTSLLDNILAYPLPLEFRLEMDPINDRSQWKIVNVLYRHEYFATSTEFIRALEAGSVAVVPTEPFSTNPFWQTLNHRQTGRPKNNAAPAINVQPTKRYTVKGGRVEWLGWSFHVKNRLRTSMAIHDVSFMGDRIAYELVCRNFRQSIPAAKRTCPTNTCLTVSSDTAHSIESSRRELIVLPRRHFSITYASLNWTLAFRCGAKTTRATIFMLAPKAHQLVVRSIFPVGNYDYLVEAKFSLDGSIGMGFSATGQLYMSYYDETEESFGTKVHDEALANVHAHFAAFKVDLDILGQNNCVEKTSVKYGPRTEIPGTETDHPDLHVPEKNMYIHRTIVETEDEARVKVNNQAPVQWKVASCSEMNQWGYHKGYDIIHPNTPLGHYGRTIVQRLSHDIFPEEGTR